MRFIDIGKQQAQESASMPPREVAVVLLMLTNPQLQAVLCWYPTRTMRVQEDGCVREAPTILMLFPWLVGALRGLEGGSRA
jgi:hypothetical protein